MELYFYRDSNLITVDIIFDTLNAVSQFHVLWFLKTIFSFIRTFSIALPVFSIFRLREKIFFLNLWRILYTEFEQFLIVVLIFCESSEIFTSRIIFFLGFSYSLIFDFLRFLRFLDWVLVIILVFEASLSETRDGDFRGYCVSGISVLYMMLEEGVFTS